jgi:hypothetical protein
MNDLIKRILDHTLYVLETEEADDYIQDSVELGRELSELGNELNLRERCEAEVENYLLEMIPITPGKDSMIRALAEDQARKIVDLFLPREI